MAHLALYRKYRSQTFGDLAGQEHVVRTIQNGIASGRMAHSYLFTGPRGTGKTSTARLLAKAINCESGPAPEPCNTCETCRSITAGTCLDVFEMDAASESGVDEVRERIVAAAEYAPTSCRRKIYIIDEVHDLSGKAFDALLKTIEEPPSHVVFILATTELNKVPPTIRSRCQRYEFHRASMTDLVTRLKYVADAEGAEVEPAALNALARMADGGYRDALTLLEQALLTTEGVLTTDHVFAQLGMVSEQSVDELLDAIAGGEAAAAMTRLEAIYQSGRDPRAVLDSMAYRLADLTRAAYGVTGGTDAADDASRHARATSLGRERLVRFREAVAGWQSSIRDVSLPRLWLEAQMLSLTVPAPVAAPALVAPAVSAASAPRPRPVAAAPESGPAPRPAAAPASESPAPTGPAPTGLAATWNQAREELFTVSRTLRMKLDRVEVAQVNGTAHTLAFERTVDLNWIRERPKVQAAILEAWLKVGGTGTLSYAAAENGPQSHDEAGARIDQPVERPAEGTRLQQMGAEVFADLTRPPEA